MPGEGCSQRLLSSAGTGAVDTYPWEKHGTSFQQASRVPPACCQCCSTRCATYAHVSCRAAVCSLQAHACMMYQSSEICCLCYNCNINQYEVLYTQPIAVMAPAAVADWQFVATICWTPGDGADKEWHIWHLWHITATVAHGCTDAVPQSCGQRTSGHHCSYCVAHGQNMLARGVEGLSSVHLNT
jgi:hypothetical protein